MVENHKLVAENSGLLTIAALKHLKCKDKKIVSIISGGNMDIITMSSTLQHGLIPVSYTHLDVYKRQRLIRF